MMGGWGDPVVGGVALRRAAIQSPNFVSGSTGWTINQDGSVEFNNGTFRGTITASTFQGTDFVINSNGEFYYSGTPAAGNLVESVSQFPGTDSFGNAYLAGFTAYDHSANTFVQNVGGKIVMGALVAGSPDTAHAAVVQSAGGNLQVSSPDSASATIPANQVMGPGASGASLSSGLGPTEYHYGSSTTPLLLGAVGAWTHASINGLGALVADTWQIPTVTAAGFANGGFANELGCQYRIDAEDNLIMIVAVTVTAAGGVAAGTTTTLFTLPAAFRPAKGVRQAAYASTGAAGTYATGIVQSGGAVIIQNPTALAQNQTVQFQSMIPMGNLA